MVRYTPKPAGQAQDIVIRDIQIRDCQVVADIYNVWIREGGTMDTVEKTATYFHTVMDAFDGREAILVLEKGQEILG